MNRFFSFLFLGLFCTCNYAWNAIGHQLVAQIAYDNLSPQAKVFCDNLNSEFASFAKASSFVKSATWLDVLRYHDVHWFDALHYIDIPVSKDGTVLPAISETNASWGIKQALAVLSSDKSSAMEKGLSLRILIHLVGDIHQPLHTITQVDKDLPRGDLGGNLFTLPKNPIGRNLHSYWDNGGGLLIGSNKAFQIQNKAHQLEKRWTCAEANKIKKTDQWINESHNLAISHVYTLKPKEIPSKQYQLKAQKLSEKRIFFAGCRLAGLLNDIAVNKTNLQSKN